MSKNFYLLLLLLLQVLYPFTVFSQASSVSIGEVSIDDLGMNKLLYRLDDNGDLFIDDSSLCFEMSVNYNAKNLDGKRLFCVLSVLDNNGDELADRLGMCSVITAQNILGSNVNGTFNFVMPQGWLVNKSTKETRMIKLLATVTTFEKDGVNIEKEINLSGDALKVDNRNLPGKLMGDIFGGSESDGISDLIGGLFGGPSASSTQRCPTCDGTRLCQSCDGDGFFDPAACRKCSKAPGVCRRCKGTGEETVKVEFHDSLF